MHPEASANDGAVLTGTPVNIKVWSSTAKYATMPTGSPETSPAEKKDESAAGSATGSTNADSQQQPEDLIVEGPTALRGNKDSQTIEKVDPVNIAINTNGNGMGQTVPQPTANHNYYGRRTNSLVSTTVESNCNDPEHQLRCAARAYETEARMLNTISAVAGAVAMTAIVAGAYVSGAIWG